MSEVITFYSYKGGVGRTMALANVSVMLAKWGHKVLVVDWDLEAPGLEHFYKDYIDVSIVEKTDGVIDLVQFDEKCHWKNCIISIEIPQSNVPLHFISSGRRDEHYFKKVRDFNVDTFYERDGGEVIEELRNEWLANYDYVLIDSRTGITEVGGICTIQLPDTVVMLFTATNQGFEGVLDIIKRASVAQQKLPYDRQKLIFLPVPSRFETNTEFQLSQDWLKIFATKLESTYNDWLPSAVDRKDFLELTKIPYIPYFSFGEKLPVIEQGVRDPSGLGYAYETIAAIVGNNMKNVHLLFNNRDEYIYDIDKHPFQDIELIKNNANNNLDEQLKQLKQQLEISKGDAKIVKSPTAVSECFQNSIFPLLEAVSSITRKFDEFFKKRNEVIQISTLDYGEKPYSYNKEIINEIVNKSKEDIISCHYTCYFSRFLISDRGINDVYISIIIKFLYLHYEIIFEDPKMNIVKRYDEILTYDEFEQIAQALGISLLKKISAVIK